MISPPDQESLVNIKSRIKKFHLSHYGIISAKCRRFRIIKDFADFFLIEGQQEKNGKQY